MELHNRHFFLMFIKQMLLISEDIIILKKEIVTLNLKLDSALKKNIDLEVINRELRENVINFKKEILLNNNKKIIIMSMIIVSGLGLGYVSHLIANKIIAPYLITQILDIINRFGLNKVWEYGVIDKDLNIFIVRLNGPDINILIKLSDNTLMPVSDYITQMSADNIAMTSEITNLISNIS